MNKQITVYIRVESDSYLSCLKDFELEIKMYFIYEYHISLFENSLGGGLNLVSLQFAHRIFFFFFGGGGGGVWESSPQLNALRSQSEC